MADRVKPATDEYLDGIGAELSRYFNDGEKARILPSAWARIRARIDAEKARADALGKCAKEYEARAEIHGKARESAEKCIADLRQALRDLLSDTQHVDHDCGSSNCPVRRAREALREKKP